MSAPTYPASSATAVTQPTRNSHYNNLRLDALYAGAAATEAVTIGAMLARYINNVRPAYLATNKIRIPFSSTRPPALMVNGYLLVATANVDLASAPAGGAARYYIFANRAVGSTTFTITVNTSATEATDTRLIGEFYFDGTNIDQGSIQAEELYNVNLNPFIGTDAEKSASPTAGDLYVATDTKLTYICYVAGTWTPVNGVLDSVSPDIIITNSNAETTVYTFSVPANSLGTDRFLEIRIPFTFVNTSGGGVTALAKVKYGATTLVTTTASSLTTANTIFGEIIVYLKANAASNAQRATAWFIGYKNNVAPECWGAGEGTAAEDSTLAKTLTVTITLGTASPNATFTRRMGLTRLLKGS